MMHPDHERPAKDAILISTARLWAMRGTCPRLPVGAVIAHESRIVSTGYNGAPSGLPHCTHTGQYLSAERRVYEPCNQAVHAEANAVAFAARYGVSIEGAVMYCTHSPCYACALLIVNSGISRLVYKTPFRDPYPLETLTAAGVIVDHFTGDALI